MKEIMQIRYKYDIFTDIRPKQLNRNFENFFNGFHLLLMRVSRNQKNYEFLDYKKI